MTSAVMHNGTIESGMTLDDRVAYWCLPKCTCGWSGTAAATMKEAAVQLSAHYAQMKARSRESELER